MLTNIENRLEELFEMIEMMPPDKVELAEKVRSFSLVRDIYLVTDLYEAYNRQLWLHETKWLETFLLIKKIVI